MYTADGGYRHIVVKLNIIFCVVKSERVDLDLGQHVVSLATDGAPTLARAPPFLTGLVVQLLVSMPKIFHCLFVCCAPVSDIHALCAKLPEVRSVCAILKFVQLLRFSQISAILEPAWKHLKNKLEARAQSVQQLEKQRGKQVLFCPLEGGFNAQPMTLNPVSSGM